MYDNIVTEINDVLIGESNTEFKYNRALRTIKAKDAYEVSVLNFNYKRVDSLFFWIFHMFRDNPYGLAIQKDRTFTIKSKSSHHGGLLKTYYNYIYLFVVKNKNDTAVVRIDIDEYYDFDGRGCVDTFKVAIY